MRKLLLGCVALLFVGSAYGGVKQYSVEDFFRDPDLSGWQLSPDGEHMLVVAPSRDPKHKGARNIYLLDVDNPAKGLQLLTNEDNHVINIGWFNNERIYYGVLEDGSDTAGLWAVNIDGSKFRELVKPAAAAQRVFRYAQVFDLLPEEEDYCLVISNEDRLNYPEVYKFDIYNGGKKLVVSNPGYVTGWIADNDGVVRAGVETYGDLTSKVIYRDNEDAEWETIKVNQDPDAAWAPAGFLEDNKTMLVVSNEDTDTVALYLYDTASRQILEKVFEDPTYDLGGIITHRKTREVLGISVQRDKPYIEYFDPKYAQLQATLDASFPDTINRISSIDEDDTIAVVTTYNSTEPGTWYKFDIENMKIELLAQSYSWIDRNDMVEQKPVTFPARDGTTIHGYLSLPKSYQGQPVPLIALPHGGPWARDTYGGFFTWIQYLANRGFGVLMVNFRGSTGYGREYLESAYRRPDISYNDIIDGVDWAIEQGFADPSNLGVLGFSWGGTSTMASIVYNPGKFQFGVAMAGQYDLPDGINHWQSIGNDLGTVVWRHRMGDPRDDEMKEFLEKWSPINHIDKVDVPIYIYHGTKDINVDVSESRRLVSQLKRVGVDPVVVYKKDEAHGMSIQENRLEAWTKIDEFLQPFMPKPRLSMK